MEVLHNDIVGTLLSPQVKSCSLELEIRVLRCTIYVGFYGHILVDHFNSHGSNFELSINAQGFRIAEVSRGWTRMIKVRPYHFIRDEKAIISDSVSSQPWIIYYIYSRQSHFPKYHRRVINLKKKNTITIISKNNFKTFI